VAPVSFFATARKVSGRNGKRSASPGYPERRPQTQNKKRKSYYEKQKKYPDLRRRRTLHPRDLGEFVAGRAQDTPTMARSLAARSTVTAKNLPISGPLSPAHGT
jgi:hypothetical protein